MQGIDWDDFKFMQAIARAGSVRGAGEILRVHGSTVARHLEQLESRVGTRLFARTRRGMEITAAGAEVIEVLDRVADELEQVEQRLRIRGPRLDGSVALALPQMLASHLVIPHLEELLRQADIRLALRTGPALEALQRGEADLALLMTDDPPQDLIGRPLGAIMATAYATAEVVDAISAGQAVPWIGPADPGSLSARARKRYFASLTQGIEIDDPQVRLAAVEAGLGTGLLPCLLADPRPALHRAPGMEPLVAGEAWLFFRPESRGIAVIQTVSAFLQSLFERNRERLDGSTDRPPPAQSAEPARRVRKRRTKREKSHE